MASEEEEIPAEEEEEEQQEEEEEDLIDHQEVYKEKCAALPSCSKWQEELESCNDRVSSRSNTTEECTQELFDFLHCVDHCVAKNLFSKLK